MTSNASLIDDLKKLNQITAKLNRAVDVQAALLELSNQLLLRSDTNELLQLIVNQTQKLVNAKEATLLVRGDDPNHLILGATSDALIETELAGRRRALDEGLSSIVLIRNSQDIVGDDPGKLEGNLSQPIKWWSRESQDSATLIPLLLEEDLIGALPENMRNLACLD